MQHFGLKLSLYVDRHSSFDDQSESTETEYIEAALVKISALLQV